MASQRLYDIAYYKVVQIRLYFNRTTVNVLFPRHIEFDEFLEFIIARQGDGRDVHAEIMQVSTFTYTSHMKRGRKRN